MYQARHLLCDSPESHSALHLSWRQELSFLCLNMDDRSVPAYHSVSFARCTSRDTEKWPERCKRASAGPQCIRSQGSLWITWELVMLRCQQDVVDMQVTDVPSASKLLGNASSHRWLRRQVSRDSLLLQGQKKHAVAGELRVAISRGPSSRAPHFHEMFPSFFGIRVGEGPEGPACTSQTDEVPEASRECTLKHLHCWWTGDNPTARTASNLNWWWSRY